MLKRLPNHHESTIDERNCLWNWYKLKK